MGLCICWQVDFFGDKGFNTSEGFWNKIPEEDGNISFDVSMILQVVTNGSLVVKIELLLANLPLSNAKSYLPCGTTSSISSSFSSSYGSNITGESVTKII